MVEVIATADLSVPYSDVFPRHNQHNAFVFYLLHPSFLTVRRPLVAWSYVMCKQRGLLSILKEVCPEKRAHWQAPGRLVKAAMRRRARALGKGMSWRESIRLLSAIFSPSSTVLCFRGETRHGASMSGSFPYHQEIAICVAATSAHSPTQSLHALLGDCEFCVGDLHWLARPSCYLDGWT